MKSKLAMSIIGELIVLFLTIQCFMITYSIYWGDFLSGSFGGLIFAFFGWIPALIGFCLIPANIALLIIIVIEWNKERKQ